MNKQNEEAVRPLAFQLARELSEKEVESISGGSPHIPLTWDAVTERGNGRVDAHH